MSTSSFLAIIVLAQHVKTVKDELEARKLLNKRLRINKLQKEGDNGSQMVIPTILPAPASGQSLGILDAIGLDSLSQNFELTTVEVPKREESRRPQRNPFHAAVKEAAHLIGRVLEAQGVTEQDLLVATPPPFAIYQPLLLLPHTILDSDVWKTLVSKAYRGSNQSHDEDCTGVSGFFAQIAATLAVTRIAINAPIPTDKDMSSTDSSTVSEEVSITAENNNQGFVSANVLRSPTNLITLHGDFGPALPAFPRHIPSQADFEQAFWVTTTQNAIHQTWAPRYTMFSKGNVSEKARLLSSPSVTRLQNEDWAAVDLFAGIGYFAFSYARAGASSVLCWDLNPWSCEALNRGAGLNGWSSVLMAAPRGDSSDGALVNRVPSYELESSPVFQIYCQSNSYAADQIAELRSVLAPVRHVNCGMLPDAVKAWQTAVKCLDWQLGGWLHMHETVREDSIETRAEAIRHAIEKLAQELAHGQEADDQTTLTRLKKVTIEHVERVKSVGPRMMHIVVDLHISGI